MSKKAEHKANYLAAKDVAQRLNMTPKNFRKHLRTLEVQAERKQKQYRFTEKQADAIVAKLSHEDEAPDAATTQA